MIEIRKTIKEMVISHNKLIATLKSGMKLRLICVVMAIIQTSFSRCGAGFILSPVQMIIM